MISEKEKFLVYKKIRRRGLYNIMDYSRIIAHAKKCYGMDISVADYLFIVANYPKLRRKYIDEKR